VSDIGVLLILVALGKNKTKLALDIIQRWREIVARNVDEIGLNCQKNQNIVTTFFLRKGCK
jgi:hypothetical protein